MTTHNRAAQFNNCLSDELKKKGVDPDSEKGKEIAAAVKKEIREKHNSQATISIMRQIVHRLAQSMSDTQEMTLELSEMETTETRPKQDPDAPGKGSSLPAKRFQ